MKYGKKDDQTTKITDLKTKSKKMKHTVSTTITIDVLDLKDSHFIVYTIIIIQMPTH